MLVSNEFKNNKKALIIGITGQDGSYLSELLISKDYEVHGMIRRSSCLNTHNINHLIKENKVKLHYGDLTDKNRLASIIDNIKPNEIYNLGAQSDVKASFDAAVYTMQIDGLGTLRLLDAIKICKLENHCKFYQAATSELFGKSKKAPHSETSPFYPRSPYGVAKIYSFWITINFREAYNMFAVNGILFNHESPRRGVNFVTRKITQGAAKISLDLQEFITLGNIDVKRDWGHAKDYVEVFFFEFKMTFLFKNNM